MINIFPQQRFRIGAKNIAFSIERRTAVDERLRGGDLFDWYHHRDGSSTVLLADVSSKGSLGFAQAKMLRNAFRLCAGLERGPSFIVSELNGLPFDGFHSSPSGAFATAFVATIGRFARTLCYASAGHDTALIVRGRGHRHLGQTGPVIGVVCDATFNDCVVAFESEDLLLIATDGFTECRSRDDASVQFGTSGIVRALARRAPPTHMAASAFVACASDAFTDNRYRDDATLVAIARSTMS